MRTLGRVIGGLGLGLILVGGVGAVALLPPPVLDSAGSYVETRRQALRAHLPEVPELKGLITGRTEDGCGAKSGDKDADKPSADGWGAAAPPDGAAPADCGPDGKSGLGAGPGAPGGGFDRSRSAEDRFRAPAPEKAAQN